MRRLEELLEHADFVNRLALRLAGDQNRAADISQDTWLAVVENPPSSRSASRSWFARVARNLAARLHRGEARREQRERKAAQPERVPSAADAVARAEIRHRVVEAVLVLDEPYRSTILLRYYENLAPREIAASQGVPVETVRTRLKRGIDKLRERLDASHPGGRQAWLSALLPLAGLQLAAPAAAAAAGTGAPTAVSSAGALLSGGVIMAAKIKIGLAAALIMSAAAVFVVVQPEGPDDDAPPPGEIAAAAGSVEGADVIRPNQATPAADEPAARTDRSGIDDRREPLAPSGPFIAGRVTEKGTNRPVPAFHIRLTRKPESLGPWEVIAKETVRDDDGRFFFALEEAGSYSVTVRSSRHVHSRLSDLEVPENKGLADLHVELDPGLSVTGRVVEDATGDPVVADALVGTDAATEIEPLALGFDEYCIHTYSDGEGRFVLRGLKPENQAVAAIHPDFAEGWQSFVPGETGEVVIALHPGHCVYGRALSDAGEPIARLVVDLSGGEPCIPVYRSAVTASDGTYRVGPASPGPFRVSAHPPQDETEISFGFTKEDQLVNLADQDVEVNFGPMAGWVTWRGRLIDPTGLPVGGVRISTSLDKAFARPGGSRFGREAVCVQDGFFEIFKLYPGRHNIWLAYPEHDGFEWGETVFEEPGEIARDLRLDVGAVYGEVVDARTGERVTKPCRVGLRQPPPSEIRYEANRVEEGTFCVRGVTPGEYEPSVWGSELPWVRGDKVAVAPGQIVKDLRIEIPPSGKVRFVCVGFEENEVLDYIFMITADNVASGIYGSERTITDNPQEWSTCLLPDTWTVLLSLDKGGRCKRTVQVLADETADLVIRREDFMPSSRVLAVAGSLSYSDGARAANAELTFHAGMNANLPKADQKITCMTGDDGAFVVGGFRPGEWNVRYFVEGHGSGYLPRLSIPEQAPDPFVFDGIIHRGQVTGRLYFDSDIEDALNESLRYRFQVDLEGAMQDHAAGSPQYRALEQGRGFFFSLPFVAPGTYTLHAHATGHREYESPPFSLADGQTVDVGSINLEQADFVLFEVVDTNGDPPEQLNVLFPELGPYYLQGDMGTYVATSKRLFLNDVLPDGPVKVRVKARGFKEKDLTITKAAGGFQVVKVVLEPE